MRVATFNVNSIHARLGALLQWLDETRPDVACLQELKTPQEKFPEAEIRAAGYIPIWHGQKSWNGVAILARGVEPVEVTRGLPGDPADEQSRYIEAMVNGVLRRLPVPPERQSGAGAEVRLQAGLDRAPAAARPGATSTPARRWSSPATTT
jgi:exodeoxyribonuclease III